MAGVAVAGDPISTSDGADAAADCAAAAAADAAVDADVCAVGGPAHAPAPLRTAHPSAWRNIMLSSDPDLIIGSLMNMSGLDRKI